MHTICEQLDVAHGSQILTMVFLLELIAGAKEFKLGFSGMHLTPSEMTSNIQVSDELFRFV
jgi:hypothetical protein